MTDGATIGQVIAQLEEEFPEVTVSKIRFLESKGLIDPARTESGYRAFSSEDVSRIRYILQQQRDHFLPLKVIKSNLAAWERGSDGAGGEGGAAPPETYFATTTLAMTAAELGRSAGLTEDQIRALVDSNVIAAAGDRNGEPIYDEEALEILRPARRLLGQGLDSRHIRQIRLGAERSLDLLDNLTRPLLARSSPESREEVRQILAECGQAITELQEAVLRGELRKLVADDD